MVQNCDSLWPVVVNIYWQIMDCNLLFMSSFLILLVVVLLQNVSVHNITTNTMTY